jgi:hypothetical protein
MHLNQRSARSQSYSTSLWQWTPSKKKEKLTADQLVLPLTWTVSTQASQLFKIFFSDMIDALSWNYGNFSSNTVFKFFKTVTTTLYFLFC